MRYELSKKKVALSRTEDIAGQEGGDEPLSWFSFFLRCAELGLSMREVLLYDIEEVEVQLHGLATRQQHYYNMARIIATAIYQVNSSKPVLASELFELPLIDGQRERIDPEELKKRAIKLFKLENDGADGN